MRWRLGRYPTAAAWEAFSIGMSCHQAIEELHTARRRPRHGRCAPKTVGHPPASKTYPASCRAHRTSSGSWPDKKCSAAADAILAATWQAFATRDIDPARPGLPWPGDCLAPPALCLLPCQLLARHPRRSLPGSIAPQVEASSGQLHAQHPCANSTIRTECLPPGIAGC